MTRKLKELKQQDFSMKIIKDLGLLPYGTQGKTSRYGIFECKKCHKHITIRPTWLKTNKTGKCRECRISEGNTKHGYSKEKLHTVYRNMIDRCTNENNKFWKYYGAKGVSVEFENYEVFKKWSKSSGYTDKLTIDRIDGNGNYSPSNCRWATRTVQARNTAQIYSSNTSGFRGVCFSKASSKWQAQIKVDKTTIYIGQFYNIIDAAAAYDNYVKSNHLEHTINERKA